MFFLCFQITYQEAFNKTNNFFCLFFFRSVCLFTHVSQRIRILYERSFVLDLNMIINKEGLQISKQPSFQSIQSGRVELDQVLLEESD